MEVYIDVLILENVVLNYLILYITSKFLRIKIKDWRALLAALAGTLYVIVMLIIPSAAFYFSFIGKILLSAIMILITFKVKKIKEFLKMFVCFYISTFMFAGAAYAYIYMTGSGGFVQNGVYYIFKKGNINMIIFALLFALILVKFFYQTVFVKSRHAGDLIDFEIMIGGRSMDLKGLVDTGNSLHDPLSNLPVVVCELEALKNIIPERLINVIKDESLTDLSKLDMFIPKIRLIPYNSLGKDNGMLLGFKADKLFIKNNKNEKIGECSAIVCLYDKHLSSNNTYNALLSPDLIAVS